MNANYKTDNELTKKHFFWIDFAKAISIFGVVYIHSGINDNPLFINTTSYFRFCVPIFIIISFFLAEHSHLNSRKQNSKFYFLKKRLSRLMIPYVFWSLLYAFGQYFLGIRSVIDFGPTFAWQGQYFFIILFQLTIIYPWLRIIKVNRFKLTLFLIATCLLYMARYFGLTLPFIFSGETAFFYWLFYVYLAIYIAQNQEIIKKFLDTISLFLIIVTIILFPLSIIAESISIEHHFEYLSISVVMTSSAIIFCSLRLDNFNTFYQSKYIISLLSKYSLGIFCVNPIIISLIVNTAKYLGMDTNILLHPLNDLILRLLIATLTCYFAIKICSLFNRVNLSSLVK